MPVDPNHFVRTFLGSIARPREAQLYLKLFLKLPKTGFAVIGAESGVFEQAVGLVIEPVRFLGQLGLFPVIAVNLLDQSDQPAASQILAGLHQAGVSADLFPSNLATLSDQVGRALLSDTVAVVDFGAESAPFERLKALTQGLKTRKLMLLRSSGGLGPKEPGLMRLTESHQLLIGDRGISVVNLHTDYAPLLAGNALSEAEIAVLKLIKPLHETHLELQTSLTSPLHLLSELFSVRGAGTLIKTGNNIRICKGFTELDLSRLLKLLEGTFAKKVKPEFLRRAPSRIYLEGDYRGAAILHVGDPKLQARSGEAPAFLTKFAVDPAAQGEGVGRDLWEEVIRDQPALYWRARVKNPVTPWYATQCDGMQRDGEWQVFWRGVGSDHIPALVRDAIARPKDFEPSSKPSP